ncbi:phosphatases II [Lactarius deliciosus]|nr:phosphatases II [Lactarius deliciosus]
MHLASQFHGSDYSCAKFGAGDNLKERQALYADTEAWWLCDPEPIATPGLTLPLHSHPSHPVAFVQTSPNLQHELQSAIDTPLIPPTWLCGEIPIPKTSDTHPISVSAVIPQDLLSSISLHISLADSSSPTIFNIHPAFSLHRLTASSASLLTSSSSGVSGRTYSDRPMLPGRPVGKVPLPLSAASSRTHLQIWSRVSMKMTPAAPRLPPLAFGSIDLIGEIFSTSHFDLDVNGSPISGSHVRHDRTLPPSIPTHGITRRPKLAHLGSRLVSHPATSSDSPQPASPALGNLFLSSCPGKKVRLTGPVRGRGAVCRDLEQDLRRIKALGVGCIVCCLDDEELNFLGAPWPEYSQAAREIGLDILRIPIPEGLAPASLEQFDTHLTRLISVYTLAGVPVLAHCRGGVGRAGLVACCWMLKLGLCGWVPTTDNSDAGDEGQVRRDTLEQAEKVIGVVRRRRSLKAIETYEQVKFLVGYVDYLRCGGK